MFKCIPGSNQTYLWLVWIGSSHTDLEINQIYHIPKENMSIAEKRSEGRWVCLEKERNLDAHLTLLVDTFKIFG